MKFFLEAKCKTLWLLQVLLTKSLFHCSGLDLVLLIYFVKLSHKKGQGYYIYLYRFKKEQNISHTWKKKELLWTVFLLSGLLQYLAKNFCVLLLSSILRLKAWYMGSPNSCRRFGLSRKPVGIRVWSFEVVKRVLR